MALQGVILVGILFILPLCIGLFPVHFMRKEHQSVGMMYVSGWLFLFALFQFTVIPFIVNEKKFTTYARLYTALVLVFVLAALVLGRKTLSDCIASSFCKPDRSMGRILAWSAVWLLIIMQMVFAFHMQYLDGDDSLYVAHSVITDFYDDMYVRSPYYGYSQPLDIRHALSPLPVFIAWAARLTGIQAAALSHSFIGPVFLLLMYLIYMQLGKRLFEEKRQYVPVFMLFLILWYIFGNVSLYTTETFAFTRTWQGKSMFGNIVVPAYFLWLMFVQRDSMKCGEWGMLFALSAVAAFTTSTGIFMVPVIMALAGLFLAVWKKRVVLLFEFAVCCIPSLVYGILYLFLKS